MARLRRKNSLSSRITIAADRMAFSWKIREAFYRHLASKTESNMKIEEALSLFRERMVRRKKPTSIKVMDDITRRMKDGKTLSEAIAQWIPAEELSIVSSGEESGNLSASLRLIIEMTRRTNRIKATLKKAMVNPMLYSIMIYFMMWFLGRFVLPSFQQALPRQNASGDVHAIYIMSDLANSWWGVVPILLTAALVALIIWTLPRWTGRYRIFFERYFPWRFYRDSYGYGWLMSHVAMTEAGITEIDAIKDQIERANPWLKERLQRYLRLMQDGTPLPAALMMDGGKGMPAFEFPNPDIVDELHALDGTENFFSSIMDVLTQWALDMEESTNAMSKRFGFIAELIIWILFGFIFVASNNMSIQLGHFSSMG